MKGSATLTINGDSLIDASGRALDGNHDGKPGGSLTASVGKTGSVSIQSLHRHTSAVDHLLGLGVTVGKGRRLGTL